MLEKHLWNRFLLYLVVEILQLIQRCSIKEVIWKTSQNSQINTRSSHPEVFLSKDVLKNFAKFTDKHLCRSLFLMKLQAGNLKLSETATGDVLWKKVFLKRCTDVSEHPFIDPLQNRCSWIIHKLHRKKPVLESLFIKVAVLRACNFIK